MLIHAFLDPVSTKTTAYISQETDEANDALPKHISMGIIADIVLGAIAFIGILVGLLFFALHRREQGRRPKSSDDVEVEKESNRSTDMKNHLPLNDLVHQETGERRLPIKLVKPSLGILQIMNNRK